MTLSNRTQKKTLPEAKRALAESIERASPSQIVKRHPLGTIAIALGIGTCLGYSKSARRGISMFTDLALFSTNRLISQAIGIIEKRNIEKKAETALKTDHFHKDDQAIK